MSEEERMATLRGEISARLSNICCDMSAIDFAELVDSITRNARKSEMRPVNWGTRALVLPHG
jgi:hypothetical protein